MGYPIPWCSLFGSDERNLAIRPPIFDLTIGGQSDTAKGTRHVKTGKARGKRSKLLSFSGIQSNN
jgi:hypothetical protein